MKTILSKIQKRCLRHMIASTFFVCICGNQLLVAEHQSVVVGIDGDGLLP